MMHRALYDAIKFAFTATITNEDLEAFFKSSLEDQIAVITELMTESKSPYVFGAGQAEARCYLVVMYIALQLVKPDSPELYKLKEDLKIPVFTKWEKANPPTTDYQLFSPMHEPSWALEMSQMSAAARLLSFSSLANREDIQVAVRTSMGIGGMEDIGDSRVLPDTDPTLELGCKFAMFSIRKIRTDWCDKDGLLSTDSVADPRPLYVLDAEKELEAQKRRDEIKQKSVIARREKLQKAYEERKVIVFDALEPHGLTLFVDLLCKMSFETFKETGPALVAKNVDEVLSLIPIVQAPKDKDEANKMIQENLNLIEQYIFTKVAKLNPHWFRVLTNGDLSIRRNISGPDIPGVYTRAEKSNRIQLNKMIEKYGMKELASAVLAIMGIDKSIADVFGTLPEKSAITFTKQEETTE